MIQDKIFFDEKDPTGLSYNTPFTIYGSYQGRLWSKTPAGAIKYYAQSSDLSAYATTGSNSFDGSQVITGSLTVTGGVTGTAASASYVEYDSINGKPTLVSSSAQVLEYNIFATTGSNQFDGDQAITGSLTTTGTIVAQTLNVQQVTSSIVYSSGSNIFGNSSSNIQQFTGSVDVTGSLAVNGVGTFTSNIIAKGTSVGGTAIEPLSILNSDGGGGNLTIQNFYTTLGKIGVISEDVGSGTFNDGVFKVQLAADGTLQDRLTISSRGAATFSSSVTTSGNISVNSDGISIDRSTSGEPYIFFRKDGVDRGSIYGVTGGGLRIFDENNNQVLTITETKVGINAPTPLGKLDIYRPAGGSGTTAIVISNGEGGGGRNWGLSTEVVTAGDFAILQSTTNGGIPTPTGSNVKLYINSVGNVGVGTSNPRTRLQVTPQSNAEVPVLGQATGVATFTSANTNYGLQFNSTSDGSFHIQSQRFDNISTAYNLILNYAGGNVAIGTQSAYGKLQITGAHTSGYGILNINSSDSCLISLDSSSTYDVRLRFKYQGTDQWFTGMYDDTSYKFINGPGTTILTLAQSGAATFSSIIDGTIIRLSSTQPLSFTGGGNTGTFTQSAIYSSQNNVSGNEANGIFIERGRITDSSSSEIRHFVIGSRGGQIQWKLSGTGGSTQYDTAEVKAKADGEDLFIGRYSAGSAKLFRVYQSSADGYLELRTGADSVVTKLSGYTGTPAYMNTKLTVGGTSSYTSATLASEGGLKVQRSIYGWYQAGSNAWDGSNYLHLKTNISSGLGGNIHYTMSLFTARLYSYTGTIREGQLGFHNWDGTFYAVASTGNIWSSPYRSSDGFIVLVLTIISSSHTGVTIDWHQAFPYPFVDKVVTSVSASSSTSAVY